MKFMKLKLLISIHKLVCIMFLLNRIQCELQIRK
jgi:hypothetical protein